MTIYATPQDLMVWMGTDAPLANATPLLRSASTLVGAAIRAAVYDVSDGLPTDADKLAAVKDATCAQAATWSVLGIDPQRAGVAEEPVVASKALGDASVSYVNDQMSATQRAAIAKSLTPEAFSILRDAGLTSSRVGSGVLFSDVRFVGAIYDPTTGESLGYV